MSAWNWAICDAEGVVDRFSTMTEAFAELPEYPADCVVRFVPDPNPGWGDES